MLYIVLYILVFSNFLLTAYSKLSCSRDGELLPDDTNCRKYFKCSNGQPATQSCPGTLIFDPILSICNWPDSTTCIQELKPKKTIRKEEISEEKESVEDREEVSSLFHIKERDIGSLRERHRRLRERMRQRSEREKTSTTTTTKPKRTRIDDYDDDDDRSSSSSLGSSSSRGSLLFRNRQETLSKEREREQLIAKLNQNRFETVDRNVNARRPTRPREEDLNDSDNEKDELLERLRDFEKEKEELIRRLNKLESANGGSGPTKFREREREREPFREREREREPFREREREREPFRERTTKKPRKKLKPIVCRENNELHANPKSCRKYFKCENGQPSLQSCPANLIFDANINVCNWPDATECIEDPDAILPQLGSSDVHPPSASIFRRPSPPSFSDEDEESFQRGPPAPPAQPQGRVPTLQEALEREQILTNEYPLFRKVLETVKTLDNDEVDLIKPLRADNPDNVKRVEFILNQENFEDLFPRRHSSYTYTRMLQAIGKFPAICGYQRSETKSDDICRRTLATMFAHFAQETGEHNKSDKEVEEWRQGLAHLRELGCTDTSPGCNYNDNCEKTDSLTNKWSCGKDRSGNWKKYYGRGAKQLSYNFNYGQFSQAMFGEGRLLLDHPDFVADTWLNLASATWFYVTPQPPKPSMLHVIDGTWVPNSADRRNGINPGFGATINIINGGIECNKPDGRESKQSLNRADYYKQFAWYLYVDHSSEELGCGQQGKFSQEGAGALPIYWDKDWAADYACKLVSYQTAHSALVKGEYVDCVEESFNVEIR